ncbi:MAG: hypothetical protein HY984_00360, partial [Candidatus Magasanikbacteria bacterium]|nr:hypothetical protein [Candidatus Magasanikbacteria bacterium]
MLRGLVIFLFLLAPAYLAYLIWLYFRTKVPYVVTPRKRFSVILDVMRITPQTVIFDLGCGKGDVLFAAEKFHPKELVGFEMSPLHVWCACARAILTRSRVRVYRQNFFSADISRADVIYIFLVQAIVEEIWKKICREGKPGARVIVLSNAIPNMAGEHITDKKDLNKKNSGVYVYRVPPRDSVRFSPA